MAKPSEHGRDADGYAALAQMGEGGAVAMQRRWKFDQSNPYEDSFEDGLLRTVSSKLVFDMILRKCADIQRAPTQNPFGLVRGKVMYIAKTGRVKFGEMEVDPLLIVYTLKQRERLIQRVFVCRAADWVEENATSDQINRALRPAIERALAKVSEFVNKGTPPSVSNRDRQQWLRDRVRALGRELKSRDRDAEYQGYISQIVATGDSALVISDAEWDGTLETNRDPLRVPYYHCKLAELLDLSGRLDSQHVLLDQPWASRPISSDSLHATAARVLDGFTRTGVLFDDGDDEPSKP